MPFFAAWTRLSPSSPLPLVPSIYLSASCAVSLILPFCTFLSVSVRVHCSCIVLCSCRGGVSCAPLALLCQEGRVAQFLAFLLLTLTLAASALIMVILSHTLSHSLPRTLSHYLAPPPLSLLDDVTRAGGELG